MFYKIRPKDFNPVINVVSCLLEYNGEILLLKRLKGKPEAEKWGIPAGKVDSGESLEKAIIREIFEETKIIINPKDLIYMAEYYVRYPKMDFNYNTFRVILKHKPDVKIKLDEHSSYIWAKPKKALTMDLVMDEHPNIEITYNIQRH